MVKRNKASSKEISSEGTTPRNYVDLLGSLCDLISGSGGGVISFDNGGNQIWYTGGAAANSVFGSRVSW